MCFAFDARPPDLPPDLALAPMSGGAGAELIQLTSEDGTRFSAALAGSSPGSGGPGVLILPDVRGLYPFYMELAERFALAGYHAIAIDYFGRTAGLGPRGEDFEYAPHVERLTPEQVQLDAGAALAELGKRTGAEKAVGVGFCLGGMHSFLAATNPALGLDGAVGFYALLDGTRRGIQGPLQRAAEIRCPVLGLFGGADQAIPVQDVGQFDEFLSEAGIEHDIHVYPGAPHSFFDRRAAEHADASEDAWRRVLAFLARRGPG